MPQTKLAQTQIARTLREHIADKNTVFVFNTAVAVDSWTDFIVGMEGADGWPKTVAGERFMAWDQFKGAAASVQEKDARSIPGLLRKLFARNLLSKIEGGEKIFEHIINFEYKENALTFTDWLSQILPSLGMWHKKMAENGFIANAPLNAKNGGNAAEKLCGEQDTEENRDYLKLYQLYNEFLQKEKLFEPTWQELKFNPSDTRAYIIFYPELLDDYIEYKEILEAQEKSGKLKLVHIENASQEINAQYYSSMRAELRMAALRILQENAAGTNWNEIALSVPDIENYLPYVERELQLYNIPYVVRAGTMLGKTGAGLVFKKMRDCYAGGFAFSNVRSFALDKKIPWKNPEAMQALVRLGSELKCFCEYTDSNGKRVDPWTKNLPEAKKFQNEIYFGTQELYKQLNKAVSAICGAKSFSAIKNNWTGAEGFEEKFLVEKSAMDKSANNILSRCVKKLDELIALEKDYPDICDKNISHFEFFLNELEATQYREQTKKEGVSVFPYKLSAMAAIPKQFVINASQKAITVENPLLAFLPKAQRRLLLGENSMQNNESQSYIAAYNKTGDCVFSVAEQTIGGYAIPYATLTTPKDPADFEKNLDNKDYIKQEKEFLRGGISKKSAFTPTNADEPFKKFPQKISAKIKSGFDFYYNANGLDNNADTDTVSDLVQQKIREKVGKCDSEKIFISQSAMKSFFTCPRKWIFSSVLKLQEDTLDTEIFEKYDAGLINHKILELYLKQTKTLPITDTQTKRLLGEDKIAAQIKRIITNGVEINGRIELPFATSNAYKNSSLAQEILVSQTETFVQTILVFLRWFCQPNLYGGWNIHAVEKELQFAQGDNLVLDGVVDCVLSRGEDSSIIDFKNTKSSIPKSNLVLKAPHTQDDSLGDFQMPMYFKLWEKNSKEEITGARFVPIQVNSFSEEGQEVITNEGKTTTKHATRDDFINYTLPLFDEYVAQMYSAIKNADYSVQNIASEDCKGTSGGYPCDYRAICRTIYNTAGSSINAEVEE